MRLSVLRVLVFSSVVSCAICVHVPFDLKGWKPRRCDNKRVVDSMVISAEHLGGQFTKPVTAWQWVEHVPDWDLYRVSFQGIFQKGIELECHSDVVWIFNPYRVTVFNTGCIPVSAVHKSYKYKSAIAIPKYKPPYAIKPTYKPPTTTKPTNKPTTTSKPTPTYTPPTTSKATYKPPSTTKPPTTTEPTTTSKPTTTAKPTDKPTTTAKPTTTSEPPTDKTTTTKKPVYPTQAPTDNMYPSNYLLQNIYKLFNLNLPSFETPKPIDYNYNPPTYKYPFPAYPTGEPPTTTESTNTPTTTESTNTTVASTEDPTTTDSQATAPTYPAYKPINHYNVYNTYASKDLYVQQNQHQIKDYKYPVYKPPYPAYPTGEPSTTTESTNTPTTTESTNTPTTTESTNTTVASTDAPTTTDSQTTAPTYPAYKPINQYNVYKTHAPKYPPFFDRLFY